MRLLFSAIGASGIIGAILGAGCGGSATDPPNVLLITLDTTRADALGCYGKSGDVSPALDALARAGTRFDLAIATAALTPESHASILTGLDPAQHGVRVLAGGGGMTLGAEIPTLASILRDHGYRTAAFLSAFPVSSTYGFDRGFDVFDCPAGALEPGPAGNPTWNLSRLQRRSDTTIDRTIEWVHSADAPYFVWVHCFDPHDAVLSPPPEALPKGVAPPAPGTIDLSPELYGAEVGYMDSQIARLVAALREFGAFENTVVVVVADHGEGLGDHGWQHHRILYQEEIRVPLIVRAPPAVLPRPIAAVQALVRTTDLLPTLLDFLGLRPPRPIDGASLRGLMQGAAEPPRTALADAINGYDLNALQIRSRPLDDFLYCAMDARWKLVYRPAHPEASELFDLERDPREAHDVFAEEPGHVLELERELARRKPWVTAPYAALDPKLAATAHHALAGLGYAGSEERSGGPTWAWTCPEHREWKSPEPANCSRCGSPPLLIAR